MSKGKFSKIFGLLKSINAMPGVSIEHHELVYHFTKGRTRSLRDLTPGELKSLENRLQEMGPKQIPELDALDKTRKAIISQFKSIGKTTKNAIAWAEKYGVNGVKKNFNDYTGQELFVLLRNAEKMKEQAILKINQTIRNGIPQE